MTRHGKLRHLVLDQPQVIPGVGFEEIRFGPAEHAVPGRIEANGEGRDSDQCDSSELAAHLRRRSVPRRPVLQALLAQRALFDASIRRSRSCHGQESHSPSVRPVQHAGLAIAATRPVFGQAPAVASRLDQAGRRLVVQRQPLQERRAGHRRAESLRDDHEGLRRARRRRRRRQPVRARSRKTPASATAACPMPKASCSSTRAACTGRPSAPAASRASKASARRRSSPRPCSSRPITI